MSAHAMLHQKDNCVRSLERRSKSVPDKEVVTKQTKCPKCGYINTTDCQTECPECSIIYSQYQLVVKKSFDNTLAIIGRNGLETAGEELNALAIRYPSVKATCDQYSAFIDHAIKKHLAGKHELSRGYFDKLVNKQPVLKDAVANFLGEKGSDDDKKDENISSELVVDNSDSEETDTISTIRARTNKYTGLIVFLLVFIILVIESTNKEESVSPSTSSSVSTGYTEAFLIVMNEKYGNVCKIETSGIFSRTLKVDWTKNTNKLYILKVFAEIGGAKNRLCEEGVRYFKFPNNLCRYNVIDWKTGEKESISDRAPYCFTD